MKMLLHILHCVDEELVAIKKRLRVTETRQMVPGPKGLKGEAGDQGIGSIHMIPASVTI